MPNKINKSGQYTLVPRGKLLVSLAYLRKSHDGSVGIYGTPEGLRNLAKVLSMLADLKQEQLPDHSCPATEGFHLHLNPGQQLLEHSARLTIGRLDAKGDGDTKWMTSQPAIIYEAEC